jgi:hypothetical protein
MILNLRDDIQMASSPWAMRAKRAVPRKAGWVFESTWALRVGFYFRTTNWPVRWHSLRASVCRRFLCFVSFSPLEKEMKCRHAQWLIVLNKRLQHETRKGSSRTAQNPNRDRQPLSKKLQHKTRKGSGKTTQNPNREPHILPPHSHQQPPPSPPLRPKNRAPRARTRALPRHPLTATRPPQAASHQSATSHHPKPGKPQWKQYHPASQAAPMASD